MYKNDFIGEATRMLFGKRSSVSSTHSEQSQPSQQQQHDIKQAMNVVEQITNLMYTIDQAVQRIQLSISIIPSIDALKGDIAEGLSESEKKIGELERYCEERIKQPTGTDADEIGLGRILEKTTNLKKQLSSLQVKFRKAVQIYSNKENESKLKREKLVGFENVQISRKISRQSETINHAYQGFEMEGKKRSLYHYWMLFILLIGCIDSI
ncbi:predicted protein [Naegleria gruberi]|uniref:Predicted protein n=1 Tax=Naegleria gruberi TaxID=5762 RepID=D2VQ88_NAEGR|nr:uncharacterized protein NAEGRDRAFT_80817 [Naegleria gruberi]EFC41002.1 predicted protein [Naegleria gruberi]|eukprot:XP_002673746.1 predicted protein [Naegleria gruberi strain NEG-M]